MNTTAKLCYMFFFILLTADCLTSHGQTGPYMEPYTDISIYGSHIRSKTIYGTWKMNHIWSKMDHIWSAKTIYGSHRTKQYMVIIREPTFPVYGSNRNHIWSSIYGPKPYMVQTTIYGHFCKTIYGSHMSSRPYMVPTYGPPKPYMVSRNGPYMVDHSYTGNHIWFTTYGHIYHI